MLFAWLVAFSLIAAACGSSDDTATDDTATDDDVEAVVEDDTSEDEEVMEDDEPVEDDEVVEDDEPADTGDAIFGEPNPAEGDPFVVGFPVDTGGEALDNIEAQIAAEATGEYINEFLGGIEGRPLEIQFCSTRQSVGSATDCANEFIQNGVSAVVVGATPFGEIIAGAMAEAGIPYIANVAASNAELGGPSAAILTGDVFATWGAPAAYLGENGLSNFAVLAIDVPSVKQGAELLFIPAYEAAGFNASLALVPPGTADMSANVAAISDVDAWLVIGDAAFCTSALQAVKAQSPDTPIYLTFQCVSADAADAVGGFEGVRVVQGTRLDDADPETALFDAVLERYVDEDLDGLGRGFMSDAFVATLAFDRLMEGYTGDGSAESVLAQVKGASAILPLSGGTELNCDEPALPFAPSVCSAGAWLTELDFNGAPTEFESVNTLGIFGG